MADVYRLIDENKFEELIASYIKNTDVATADKLGIIRLNASECGLQIVDGRLNGKSVSADTYKSATNTGLLITKSTLENLINADYFTSDDVLMIAPVWDINSDYSNGDLVIHNRTLYKAKNSTVAGTEWSDDDWFATTVTDSVARVSEGSVTTDAIVDEAVTEQKLSEDLQNKINNASGITTNAYDATVTYSVGDYAIYNNVLYKCIASCTGIIPGETSGWDTCWSTTDIVSEIKGNAIVFTNEAFSISVSASATVRDKKHTTTKSGYTPVFSVVTAGAYGDYVRWGQTHSLSTGTASASVSVANSQSASATVTFQHIVAWRKGD